MKTAVSSFKSTNLSVAEYTDDFAVLDHLGEVALNNLLAIIVLPLLGILRESLLLALVPSKQHRLTSSLDSPTLVNANERRCAWYKGWSSPFSSVKHTYQEWEELGSIVHPRNSCG